MPLSQQTGDREHLFRRIVRGDVIRCSYAVFGGTRQRAHSSRLLFFRTVPGFNLPCLNKSRPGVSIEVQRYEIKGVSEEEFRKEVG